MDPNHNDRDLDVDSVRRLELVGISARADILRTVLTDVQSIQQEYKAESVDLSDHQLHDYRLVVFAPALADACDASPADVYSIQMEGKIQSPYAPSTSIS